MTRYILELEQIDATCLPLVGGKGANLGELVKAGLPVPAAFCISTDAYRQFIAENQLIKPILALLEDVDYEQQADIETRSATIRDLIKASPLPQDISAEIAGAYARLEVKLGKDLPVSVRSSATAEDLPGMSFAGQQDTYLQIKGADDLLQHVRQCWGSLWTARAIAYRHRQGFKHEDVWLAVVVQEMFPSEVAGVLFTANPVTSNPLEMILNASWGLGEAIVSGKVNPDQYSIRKDTLEISQRQINEKRVMTIGHSSGRTSETEVPEERRSIATLPDHELTALAEIGRRIESHYGFPQDIEWGYANGQFAILQAREVTAADIDFHEGMELWQSANAFKELTAERWTWSRAYSDELQTGPSTPLMYSLAQPHRIRTKLRALELAEITEFAGYKAADYWDIPLFRWYGARAYYNTAIEKEWMRIFIPPFARDEVALWPFPEEQREDIRNMPFDWWRFVRIIAKLELNHPTRSLLGSTHRLYDNFENWIRHSDEVWDSFDLDNATVSEILDASKRANALNELEDNVALPFNFFLYVLPHGLQRLCERWCDDKHAEIFGALIAGQQTPTGEQNMAVWELSRKVRESNSLMDLMQEEDSLRIYQALADTPDGREFKIHLDEFLIAFGHRGANERDSYHFRWRQKPERVIPAIKPLLPLEEEDSPAAFEKRLNRRMLKTKADCLKKIRAQPFGSIKAALFKWYLELVQDYFYYRDWERFQNDKNGVRRRPMFTAIARQFIKRGLMTDEEDIFFLAMQEITLVEEGRMSARDIAIRVRARRRVYDKYSRREPAKYLCGWNTFNDDQLGDDNTLKGTAASHGVITGRARVCRSLDEISRVKKGDILVTIATDPAWTTVFSIIGGVIVETGGIVSHAVMISREYGIPCVANLNQACDLIPDGHLITVDGTSGRVQLVSA